MRKPVLGVSEQDRNKPDCTATEDGGERLDILDLGSRGIVLCSENKDAEQVCSYRATDMHFCFSHLQKAGFLMTRLS